MKKRIIWKMFVLEIVTIGIYRLYWLIKTRNEMMKTNPAIKIKSPWFLMIPVAIIIGTFIALMVSIALTVPDSTECPPQYLSDTGYPSSKLANDACTKTSTAATLASLGFMVGIFIAIIVFVIWLWSYCHGVEIITNEKISFAMALVILVLVPDGIDILIIQDGFNKVVDRAAGITPGHPQPPAQSIPPAQPMPPAAPQPPVNPPAPVQFQLA